MSSQAKKISAKLAVGAIGVVFGDIGTSPLYAVQECFAHGLRADPENIIGVISLILWGLTIVVSVKYALIIMRADNQGEGGVFSLLALALRTARRAGEDKAKDGSPQSAGSVHLARAIMVAGMFGAALFFGDSMITPAISVLSAVEGLNVITPRLADFVMPIAITILVALFVLQRFGSQKIGNSFGPIMVGWFLCLALSGFYHIVQAPGILTALNPAHALHMLATHGALSLAILGACLLAFTGGEALYADMGHFGLNSIRLAWYGLVMPTLAVNYLGQGALLLLHPEASSNPFYMMLPEALLAPMIALASVATVIASQAVISGTFSLVRQAIQMDYLPRFSVVHTSALEQGQVYLPKVNMILCLGVIMIVLLFRSSSALAGAYGFAVSGAMLVDTIMVAYVARNAWHWTTPVVLGLFLPLFLFDTTFFVTATAKIPEGGWLPLSVGLVVLSIFATWRRGRIYLRTSRQGHHEKLEQFVRGLQPGAVTRSPGTSVYLTALHDDVPPSLHSDYQRYRVLRENILIVRITRTDEAVVETKHQAHVEKLGKGFWQVTLYYGFVQHPHVTNDLRRTMQRYADVDMANPTYYVGRSIFINGPSQWKPAWRKRLFLWLANNVEEEYDYSPMPTDQMVQIGTQIEV